MPDITLDQANRIIGAALAKAREMQLKPLAVAVLDSGGHLKALAREDGQTFMRAKVCQAKAWGALAMGVHSRDLATRYERQRRGPAGWPVDPRRRGYGDRRGGHLRGRFGGRRGVRQGRHRGDRADGRSRLMSARSAA